MYVVSVCNKNYFPLTLDALVMYTVPQGAQVTLSSRLPQLNRSMKAAVLEIVRFTCYITRKA